jgi:hypothetical protein
MSFSALSKLKDTCTSKSLRTCLRTSVAFGATMVAVFLGYIACITHCECRFTQFSLNKRMVVLAMLFLLGIPMVIISSVIKKEIENKKCDTNLNSLPDVLLGISISWLVLPALCFGYTLWKGHRAVFPRSKKEKEKDENIYNDQYFDEEDQKSKAILEKENREAERIWKQRSNAARLRYTKSTNKLAKLNQQIEHLKGLGKGPSAKQMEERSKLIQQQRQNHHEFESIKSERDQASSSSASSSNYDDDDDDNNSGSIYQRQQLYRNQSQDFPGFSSWQRD